MTQIFARIANGLVAEIIPLPDGVDPASVFSPELLATLETATPDVTVGQTYAGGAFGPPPAPVAAVPPVPASVSRAQFFHAAAQAGIITNAEAIAVFTGVVPASLSTAIATLSASQQFAANIAILGNTTFERANPLLITLGAAMGKTPAQIDALFTLAASL